MIIYNIIKKGRVCQIEPIPDEKSNLAKDLENTLQYIKPNSHFYPNPEWAKVKLYKIKTGRFPFGLISLVQKVFIKNLESFKITGQVSDVINFDNIKNLNPNLRYYQKDAILQLILNNGGILCLPTGAGKTFTAIEYLKFMNKKSLVITTALNIMDQWKKQVPDFVDVVNYHKIKDYSMLKDYDIILFDENHHVSSKTLYNIAMKCNNSILIGLTATPKRDDGEEMKIHAALGDIIYTISKKELQDKGYLANFDYIEIDLQNKETSKFLDYIEIYQKMITYNKERNDKIIDCIEQNKNQHVLILVTEIEHGNILKDLLDKKNIKSRFIHGSVKDRDLKQSDTILIGTSIYDEGVDLKDFNVLILAAGGKSSIKLIQRIGRVLRPNKNGVKSLVYDFIDRSRYLNKHYLIRKNLIENEF